MTMCTVDTTNVATNGTSPIVDVVLPKPRSVLVVLITVAGAVVVVVPCIVFLKAIGFFPLSGVNTSFQWMLIGLVLGSLVGMVLYGIRKWREQPAMDRARRAMSSIRHDEIPQAVKRFCGNYSAETVLPTRSACKALAAVGKTGVVIRGFLEAAHAPVEPIEVPFEPVPLDQSDRMFSGLESGPSEKTPRAKTGWARRVELFGGRWVVMLIALGIAVQGLVHWIQGTLMAPTFWIVIVCLALPLFGLGGVGAWRRNKQCLLVPGGLAIRKTSRKAKGKWNVHLFTRTAGVLFVRERTNHQWLVCVAEDDVDDYFIVTRAEVDMLLRAWLSPLPAPPIERLSDLE